MSLPYYIHSYIRISILSTLQQKYSYLYLYIWRSISYPAPVSIHQKSNGTTRPKCSLAETYRPWFWYPEPSNLTNSRSSSCTSSVLLFVKHDIIFVRVFLPPTGFLSILIDAQCWHHIYCIIPWKAWSLHRKRTSAVLIVSFNIGVYVLNNLLI